MLTLSKNIFPDINKYPKIFSKQSNYRVIIYHNGNKKRNKIECSVMRHLLENTLLSFQELYT